MLAHVLPISISCEECLLNFSLSLPGDRTSGDPAQAGAIEYARSHFPAVRIWCFLRCKGSVMVVGVAEIGSVCVVCYTKSATFLFRMRPRGLHWHAAPLPRALECTCFAASILCSSTHIPPLSRSSRSMSLLCPESRCIQLLQCSLSSCLVRPSKVKEGSSVLSTAPVIVGTSS